MGTTESARETIGCGVHDWILPESVVVCQVKSGGSGGTRTRIIQLRLTRLEGEDDTLPWSRWPELNRLDPV